MGLLSARVLVYEQKADFNQMCKYMLYIIYNWMQQKNINSCITNKINFTQIGSMVHMLQLVIHAVFSMQVANIC